MHAQSCTAAIFLREFVAGLKNNAPEGVEQEEDEIRYAHIDIGMSFPSSLKGVSRGLTSLCPAVSWCDGEHDPSGRLQPVGHVRSARQIVDRVCQEGSGCIVNRAALHRSSQSRRNLWPSSKRQ